MRIKLQNYIEKNTIEIPREYKWYLSETNNDFFVIKTDNYEIPTRERDSLTDIVFRFLATARGVSFSKFFRPAVGPNQPRLNLCHG